MRISACVTIFGLLVGAAAPLCAQSLADVAKKEEERRKKVQDGGKVYTNGDLQAVPAAPASPPPSTLSAPLSPDPAASDKKPETKSDDKAAADKPAGKDDKAPAAGGAKDQAYWKARMDSAVAQLDRDRLYAEALQSRINALTTDFTARDDPAQRALIGQDRDKAVAELDRLKRVIQDDKDAITAVEEDARRASVPPGWLR
jgi:hypothetical protein